MDAIQLLDDFFVAACADDQNRLANIYDPNAVIWHNVDQIDKDVTTSLATLKWLAENIVNYRYTEVRSDRISGGVLRRHVCRGRVGNQEIQVPVAVIAMIEGDRILRLEEYFDSVQGASDVG